MSPTGPVEHTRLSEPATESVGGSPPSAKRREKQEALIADTNALMDEIDAVLEIESTSAPPLTLGDLIRAAREPQAVGTFATPTGATCALQGAYNVAKRMGLFTNHNKQGNCNA